MKIIEELKIRCNEYLKMANNKGDGKMVKLYETIQNILNEGNVFSRIDAEVAFNILLDLGCEKSKIKEIYVSLLKEEE